MSCEICGNDEAKYQGIAGGVPMELCAPHRRELHVHLSFYSELLLDWHELEHKIIQSRHPSSSGMSEDVRELWEGVLEKEQVFLEIIQEWKDQYE